MIDDEHDHGREDDDIVTYSTDFSYFKFIDPYRTQATNMFYTKSHVRIKDQVFDIFDLTMRDVEIFQRMGQFDYYQNIDESLSAADREYLNIYFRAHSEKQIYKREGYDLLGYLGDLGGFLDVLFVVGHGLTILLT